MHDPDGFARRLDLALRTRRIGKMYALAVALGVDESALSRWRRGKPISVGSLVRLCRHLRVSIDWLLTGSGSMEAAEPCAVEAWRSEIVADLASLDPTIRDRLADLIGRLADARRVGCFEPGVWSAEAQAGRSRPLDRRSVDL
jgi:transcriptional regulator with XRE-family HTH domain